MSLTQQSGFSFPMIQQGPQGRVLYTTQDTVALINYSIQQILLTLPGERMWNPTFGCLLKKMSFETLSATSISTIKNIILTALKLWETRITVKSSDVSVVMAPTESEFSVLITISYTVSNPDFTTSRQPMTMTVGL